MKATTTDTAILLCAVHGPDKLNYTDEWRELFFQRVAEQVKWAEGKNQHRRTVLVGDFNANPFEAAVGSINGLHAIRMRAVGGKAFRTVMGTNYEFFYNPMWSCYRQGGDAPSGTFYHNGSGVHEVFWHMIDQLVLRPELLPRFPERRLRVLRSAGISDLLTLAGLPGAEIGSDHLPILFDLQLRGAPRA